MINGPMKLYHFIKKQDLKKKDRFLHSYTPIFHLQKFLDPFIGLSKVSLILDFMVLKISLITEAKVLERNIELKGNVKI